MVHPDIVPKDWRGYKEAASLIIRKTREYSRLLGLDNQDIYVGWKLVEGGYCAECVAEPEYYKADLFFDLSGLWDKDEAEISVYVRHELLHVVLWPLCEAVSILSDMSGTYFKKLEERTVSALERAPFWDRIS